MNLLYIIFFSVGNNAYFNKIDFVGIRVHREVTQILDSGRPGSNSDSRTQGHFFV